MTLPAVILAGGRATRMGGGDKGLALVAGASLLAHVIGRLAPQCAPLALNANGDPARLAAFGLPVLPDCLPEGVPVQPGPLAGVLAALDWAAGLGASGVVTVAADTPFFPADLAARLAAAAGPSGLALAASPDASGRIWQHPTFGLWPVALAGDLRQALIDGERRMAGWAARHGAASAVFAAAPIDPFFNINRPADLAEAERLAALIGDQSAPRGAAPLRMR